MCALRNKKKTHKQKLKAQAARNGQKCAKQTDTSWGTHSLSLSLALDMMSTSLRGPTDNPPS